MLGASRSYFHGTVLPQPKLLGGSGDVASTYFVECRNPWVPSRILITLLITHVLSPPTLEVPLQLESLGQLSVEALRLKQPHQQVPNSGQDLPKREPTPRGSNPKP